MGNRCRGGDERMTNADKIEMRYLKTQLNNTDYQALKYAEGQISEEDYAPIKQKRQEWRDRINLLEDKLKEV